MELGMFGCQNSENLYLHSHRRFKLARRQLLLKVMVEHVVQIPQVRPLPIFRVV